MEVTFKAFYSNMIETIDLREDNWRQMIDDLV